MRTVRITVAAAAFLLIAAACGDDDGGLVTTTQAGNTGGTVATTTATTAGSAGGGANGSITFAISGDYEASGEFPFIPAASAFSNGGWSAMFSESGEAIISMNTLPGGFSIAFGDSVVVITGIESDGCTFDLSRNDSGGFAGNVECDGPIGFMVSSGAMITVHVQAEFSAQP
jgi:hypothetical protein